MSKKYFLFFIISFLISSSVQARLLDQDWDRHGDFDRLVSCGVVAKPFYGSQPWSEKIIKKALQNIKNNQGTMSCSQADVTEILNRFNKDIYANDQKTLIKPVEKISVFYDYVTGGNSQYTDNRRGLIDARVNTFSENTTQLVGGAGQNFSFRSNHYFSWYGQDVFLQPRFGFVSNEALLTMQQAYAHFNFFKTSLVVGRSPVLWGQGASGGFLFTTNARPLDVIQLSNAEGFRLPWLLKHLGKWKFSFLFGTLGPEQRYPWTLFSGLNIGYKPADFVEFNLSHIIHFGGEGAPDLSFSNGVQEFFGFIPFLSQTTINSANKLTALNMRFFIDRFMGFQGYIDYAMDDSTLTGGLKAWKKHFTVNSSYLLGLYFTRPFGSLSDQMRFEFTRIGHITYRHSLFHDGWTINDYIIGHAAGPDSYRVRASWTHDWVDKNRQTQLVMQWTKRDNNNYDVSDDGLEDIVLADKPSEHRYTVNLVQSLTRRNITGQFMLGYEFIHDYQFQNGDKAHAAHMGLELGYLF
ncbi:MAG: capsule assembly Wzi family protein [bacterium]